jgi:hypothetical protein
MFGWFKKRQFAASTINDPVSAIMHCDMSSAESLRGSLTPAQIREIVDTYRRLSDWEPKDIAIHLLQDCDPSKVQLVMRDALRSPTVESRAIAFCSLAKDFNLFPSFLRDGVVDPNLVDTAIKTRFGA